MERELATRGAVGGLVGESPAMLEIFSLIQQVAPTSATVLITGESGTGKELVARAIHQLSPRRTGLFFAVNCAAMRGNIDGEASCSGMRRARLLARWSGAPAASNWLRGALFCWTKLATCRLPPSRSCCACWKNGACAELGSARETDLDVRVLASTNRSLKQAIAKQAFRDDLYFRLNVFEIGLPALRDRKSDIPAAVRRTDAQPQPEA